MARTALTPVQVPIAGVALSPTAANVDGHSIVYKDTLFLYVNNASASPVTVTIQTPKTISGLGVDDQPVVVAAGAEALIRIGGYSDLYRRSDGTVYVDFSAVTSVTVEALYF